MSNLLTRNGYNKDSILKLFKESKGRNPVVVIENKEYVIGIGINGLDFADTIRKDEIANNVTKICFNPDLSYFYIVGPEYYNSISNIDYFDWVGEMKSRMINKNKLIRFGFGRGNSSLARYDF